MKHRLGVLCCLLLSSCGSVTLPAAVRLQDNSVLIGTTTASMSGGTFQVAKPDGSVRCSGTYDALDTRPTIAVPFTCTDGKYGTATVTRNPQGRSGQGFALLSDGSQASLAFGDQAAAVVNPTSVALASFPPAPTALEQPTYSASDAATRTYVGNCPTPDSLDARGRRCGARSAASRPGGYDGYGGWSTNRASSYGGSTYVRGYYRKNGTYVRGHYRRR